MIGRRQFLKAAAMIAAAPVAVLSKVLPKPQESFLDVSYKGYHFLLGGETIEVKPNSVLYEEGLDWPRRWGGIPRRSATGWRGGTP